MSLATLITWLSVTLNPFAAYTPVDADDDFISVYDAERSTRSGQCRAEGEDVDDGEDCNAGDVRPWTVTFSISNGF